MKQQRRFTEEFEDEEVRLVRTSGRTQREVVEESRSRAFDAGSLARPQPGSRGGSAWWIDSHRMWQQS